MIKVGEEENLEEGGKRGECGASQSHRAGQSQGKGTRKEAKRAPEEPNEMKNRNSAESREAPKSEEEEKKNMSKMKVKKTKEIQTTGRKDMKRTVSKMQRKNGGAQSQISVNRPKDFKDGTAVALEDDDSDIQGGFSFFKVIFNSSSIRAE